MTSEQMEFRQIGGRVKYAKVQTFSGEAFFKGSTSIKKKLISSAEQEGQNARHEGGSGECGGLQLLGLVGGDSPGNAARLGSPAPLRCLRC